MNTCLSPFILTFVRSHSNIDDPTLMTNDT